MERLCVSVANTMVGEITIYGSPEARKEFVQAIKIYGVDLEEIDELDEYAEYQGEFRWNLDRLVTQPIVDLAKKYHVAFDAKGVEPGVGFYQQVGVDIEGSVTNESMDTINNYFDYREED